jgi:predicted  nucleic acid-binding Zn-ribbon protein
MSITGNKNQIEATLGLDASGATNALKSFEKSTKGTAKETQSDIDSMNLSWAGLAAKVNLAETAIRLAGKAMQFVISGEKEIAATIGFEKKIEGSALALNKLRAATSGMVTDTALQQMAMHAQDLGLSVDQAAALSEAGLKAVLASGQDAEAGIDALTQAVVTGRAQSLRSLGVQLDTKTAYEETAKALGKTVAQLTEAEKLESRLSTVTAQLAENYKDVPLSEFELGAQQAAVQIENLTGDIQTLAAQMASWVFGSLAEGIAGLKELASLEKAFTEMLPAASAMTVAQDKYAEAMSKSAMFAKMGETALAAQMKDAAYNALMAAKQAAKLGMMQNEQAAAAGEAASAQSELNDLWSKSPDLLKENVAWLDKLAKKQKEAAPAWIDIEKGSSGIGQDIQGALRQGLEEDISAHGQVEKDENMTARLEGLDAETEKTNALADAFDNLDRARQKARATIEKYTDAVGSAASAMVDVANAAAGEEASVTTRVGLIIAEATVQTLMETARSVAAFAGGDPWGTATHAIAAGKFAIVGALNAASVARSGAGGGSGGGGGKGAAAPSTPIASAPSIAPSVEGGGPQSITINVTGPYMTKKDVQAAVGMAVVGWTSMGGKIPASAVSKNSSSWED